MHSVPPRGADAGSGSGAASCLVGTLAAGIATEAPGSRRAGHGAVTTLPAWKRGPAERHGDPAPPPTKHARQELCPALGWELRVGVGVLEAQAGGKRVHR